MLEAPVKRPGPRGSIATCTQDESESESKTKSPWQTGVKEITEAAISSGDFYLTEFFKYNGMAISIGNINRIAYVVTVLLLFFLTKPIFINFE